MKDKILEAVQISKTYGEGESAVQALKASDLTIWKGEFASIIGSSGSGKSTLLKILGGLLPPTTGNVLLDGQDIYAMNAEQLAQVRRQKIGFIFQDFRLFPEYTVRDNILIPFYLDHRTPDEQMLRKLTEILGIAEKLDARPSQISGGQQQRAAIARALIGKPRIVFADEPTGNLDTGEVAGFARWYLDDYPVFCWAEDYGLFVIGLARGSLWKYSIYTSPEYILNLAKTIPLGFGLLLLLAAICCFLLSWQGAKRLETVASGLDALAEGQTVQLPTEGFAGELAEKLNRTSAQLQTRNELLARRDDARTQWIAGVSHDVRTPLALILGWAEQLERDAVLPETARQKAGGIRTQSEKLRTLIEDLNLTSKLEYGTQPLRKQEFAAGPLFRELVAQFCESPQAESCEVSLQQTAAAEQAKLCVDRALLERLLENLLGNSIRHNSAPVEIEVQTNVAGNRFCLTVADNGTGYPPAVLAALQGMPQNEQTPHILGLHVVEQIAAAHGGRVTFGQNVPNGAKATVWLPCAEKKAPVAFGQNVVK